MGSFDPDEWYQCERCEWWGYFGSKVPDYRLLIDVDGCYETALMLCLWCYEEDEGAATATATDTTTKTESDTEHTVAANPCLEKTDEN